MSDKTIVSKCLSTQKNLAKRLPTEENDSNGGKMEKNDYSFGISCSLVVKQNSLRELTLFQRSDAGESGVSAGYPHANNCPYNSHFVTCSPQDILRIVLLRQIEGSAEK